ncbi:MAG TPA: metal ABC transporter permease [Egibacteraceae bacterium]|nr:metal ABC transporter permease [Egibacteraceae bacterium]
MTWLAEPLSYAFFVRALAAGVLIGAMCGAVSVFVVLRRMSYIGHGLAHSVLGGVAVGAALGYHHYVGAVVATLVAALLIDRVARQRGLHADAAIGIVTTAMFAAGIAIVSMVPRAGGSTEALLFGSILAVTRADLMMAAGVAAAFAAVLFFLAKPLVFVTFDPEVAAVQGVRAGVMEAVFHLLTAGVIIASVRVLGVLLVAAVVVIPAALARLVTRSIAGMLAVATAVGVVSSVAGLYLSFHAGVPSGPAIVLVGAGLFAATTLAAWAGARLVGVRARREAAFDAPHPPPGALSRLD